MRKLILLFLASTAFATTAVTGHIGTLGTTSVTSNSFARFWLRGCGGNQPRVGASAVIAPSQGGVFFFDIAANSSGDLSGTLYSNRDLTGLTGGEIECGGSHTATWYGMQIFYAGKGGPETPILAKDTDSFDISNITPITTAPVVTAPNGDSTYARLDAGNQPFTGNVAPSGTGVLALGTLTNRWKGFFSTLDVSAGGVLAGTFTGTPIFSGNLTFSGNNVFSGTNSFTAQNTFSVALQLFTSGLQSTLLKSATANPASAGLHRLASADMICWRNAGNTADVCLGPTTSVGGTDYLTAPALLNGYKIVCSDGASHGVAANTTSQQIITTCKLPAGTINATGKTFRLTTGANITPAGAGPPTSNAETAFGASTSLGTNFSALVTQGASASAWAGEWIVSCIVSAAGVSGTASCTEHSGASGAGSPVPTTKQESITLNTTADFYVGTACQFNAGSVSNTCNTSGLTVEQLN